MLKATGIKRAVQIWEGAIACLPYIMLYPEQFPDPFDRKYIIQQAEKQYFKIFIL